MNDWFDASKVIVQAKDDIYAIFATPPRDILAARFQGLGDLNFSDKKSKAQRKREGGIKDGMWVEPEVNTPHNLPPWYYGEGWSRERRYN